MSEQPSYLTVTVDLTNPGQFFACCGLLELASRMTRDATGWFDTESFRLKLPEVDPAEFLRAITTADLLQLDGENDMSSPIRLQEPFGLTLDWWNDEIAGGKGLKVWAGSMRNVRIAVAMRAALRDAIAAGPAEMFNYGTVVYELERPTKKVEPFYFDSRRGDSAHSIDIGFSPDKQEMTSTAYPVVEFLCLVGLQRFRPMALPAQRTFRYGVWNDPLKADVAAVAAAGLLPAITERAFRFENAFRTDKDQHKSFTPAIPHGDHNEFA